MLETGPSLRFPAAQAGDGGAIGVIGACIEENVQQNRALEVKAHSHISRSVVRQFDKEEVKVGIFRGRERLLARKHSGKLGRGAFVGGLVSGGGGGGGSGGGRRGCGGGGCSEWGV